MNPSLENWCALPTLMGEFRMYDTGSEHLRLVCQGAIEDQGSEPLVRIHSSCLASEVFGALDCDCADQLRESMKLIATEGRGIVIHIHQEGRGQGLSQKILAVGLMQREQLDTVGAFDRLRLEQDIRDYGEAISLLRQLGIGSVRLISNNPRKKSALEGGGMRVKLVPTHPMMRPECSDYLRTKRDKLGHLLQLEHDEPTDTPIRFYHSDQSWGELSNFSRHAIYMVHRVWPTVEHFYQAQKFVGTEHEERIRRCSSPMTAKQLAGDLAAEFRRTDWSAVKEIVMHTALVAKFSQHPDLAELLLRSGDRPLIEHTRNDAYWGDGGDGSGLNRLGELLMQVRTQLRSVAHLCPVSSQ